MRFGHLFHQSFGGSSDVMSQTQGSKEFRLTKADIVSSLRSVGQRNGQYGCYDVYSVSDLKALERRKDAEKEYASLLVKMFSD